MRLDQAFRTGSAEEIYALLQPGLVLPPMSSALEEIQVGYIMQFLNKFILPLHVYRRDMLGEELCLDDVVESFRPDALNALMGDERFPSEQRGALEYALFDFSTDAPSNKINTMYPTILPLLGRESAFYQRHLAEEREARLQKVAIPSADINASKPRF
jgi:hypothetical protein